MKLITDKAVYVKNYDLAFIGKMRRLKSDIPESISSKIPYETDERGLLKDRYKFVKFESKDEIEYFKSIQDILECENILSKDVHQIFDLLCEYTTSRIDLIRESKLNSDEKVAIIDFIKCTYNDLDEIYLAKSGKTELDLPEDVYVKTI